MWLRLSEAVGILTLRGIGAGRHGEVRVMTAAGSGESEREEGEEL